MRLWQVRRLGWGLWVLGEPEGYDPFRRVYLYGEEGQAAEDTGFRVLPGVGAALNLRLYVTVAAFGGGYMWEWETPLA